VWPHVYVMCVCLVFLCVGDLLICVCLVFLSVGDITTDNNAKHTHMTYTCGHMLRNNTNSMNANQREEY
jgi:hypothetical protein